MWPLLEKNLFFEEGGSRRRRLGRSSSQAGASQVKVFWREKLFFSKKGSQAHLNSITVNTAYYRLIRSNEGIFLKKRLFVFRAAPKPFHPPALHKFS
jgi:hypothetical protein